MKLTKTQREELKQKYAGRCAYCGDGLTDKWHADHLEAVVRETIELLRNEQDSIKKVVIEAGWENKKANFRVGGNHSRQVNEQISRRVGMNHATGILLAEIAQAMGIAVLLVKPTKSKLDAKEFNKITGWQGRTNQEVRVAAMLVYGMK